MVSNDPTTLSAQLADDAVQLVHSREEVPQEAEVEVHADPKVPGANFVEGATADEEHERYWVGLRGDVEPTQVHDPALRVNPAYRASRRAYSAAVEAVRLAHRLPASESLFAMPDGEVEDAFFVHGGRDDLDGQQVEVVRWVHPSGEVHDGYRLRDDERVWDERSRAAREGLVADS